MKADKLYILFISIIIESCQTINNPVNNDDNLFLETEVYGSVVDKYSFPIYGIPKVKIIIQSDSFLDSTSTDNNGKFIFENLLSGTYKLSAKKTNYDTVTTRILVEGEDSIKIDFELEPIYSFEPGVILVGFNDTANVNTIFQLFNTLDLDILKLKGFQYNSQLPIDSIDYVCEVLKSKPYLESVALYVSNDKIVSVLYFREFDNEDYNDWLLTKLKLQLNFINSVSNGTIKVPPDEEFNWLLQFREFCIIRWLTLNYQIPNSF